VLTCDARGTGYASTACGGTCSEQGGAHCVVNDGGSTGGAAGAGGAASGGVAGGGATSTGGAGGSSGSGGTGGASGGAAGTGGATGGTGGTTGGTGGTTGGTGGTTGGTGGATGGAGGATGGSGGTGGTTGGTGGSGCASFTANPCVSIPHFTGTQVVDGLGDEFCNVPGAILDLGNAGYVSPTGATSSTRTEIRVAWSDAGLHAFVHVDDPNVFRTTTYPWDSDNVQFFVTAETPRGGVPVVDVGYQLFILPPDATHAATSTTTTSLGPDVRVGGKVVATGYDLELLWSWTGALTPMVSSKVIGFDLVVGVNDSGGAARDFEYGLYLGTPTTTCVDLYCDDALWCHPILE
jgi:hypothetical protein